MKKITLGVVFLGMALLLSGCGRYGSGETKGIVYAVDDGLVWDKVWYKSSPQSAESDCYLLSKDNLTLKNQLRSLEPNTYVRLEYRRHLVTVGICGDDGTDDEIVSFSIINK